MKTRSLLLVIATALMAGFLTSCSSDEVTGEEQQVRQEISIARLPEFQITCGGSTLVQRQTTRAGQEDVLLYFDKHTSPDLYKMNFPAQVIPKDECEYVYARIKEDAELIAAGQAPKYEVDKNSFTYKNFYIVNAYSAKDHDAKDGYSSVAGDMHDLAINGVKIDNFNTNVNICADLVMTFDNGLQQVTYDDSFGQKRYSETVDDWKLFYIPDNNGKTYGYYIGMDYHSAKEDTHGDGEFSDWVIKVIPAEKYVDPVDEANGSVEVNVNINDKHEEGDFIATKTSIHIRALTDVEIFLPVDKKFYCEADDMDISLSHRQADITYNTEPRFVNRNIGGKWITFKVRYEDDGIHITTDGMCKEVVDFCDQMYADGMTFEVWNYFKDTTREELKVMLDKATITFLSHKSKTYVNAFSKRNFEVTTPIYNKPNENGQLVPYTDEDCTQPLDTKCWTRLNPDDKDYIFLGVKNPWDCTVTPVDRVYLATYPDATDPSLPDYNVVWTY